MYTQLVNNLDQLGFTEIEPFLSEYLNTAAKEGTSLQESLHRITEREISLRNQRVAQIQVSVSHFPYVKTIDEFDFHFQTSVNKVEIKDLATLRFLENKKTFCSMELREQGKHILRQLLVLKQLRKGILHISLHVMT